MQVQMNTKKGLDDSVALAQASDGQCRAEGHCCMAGLVHDPMILHVMAGCHGKGLQSSRKAPALPQARPAERTEWWPADNRKKERQFIESL